MHSVRVLPVLVLLAAAAASAQPAMDDRGNRMTSLPAVDRVPGEQSAMRSALHCTPAGDLCLRAWRQADEGAWFLDMHDRPPSGAAVVPARRIALPAGQSSDPEEIAIWPHLVREPSGALLIGVERTRRTGFSGGGAGATELVLLRLSAAGAEPAELLTIQTGYSAMIRACFAEADYRRLGDACHQRLEFSGRLTLAPRASGGRPRFSLDVASRTFPRGSLNEGWELGSLRRADRVWERDPACSYRRLLSYDPDTGRYVPDRPLPECSLYSLP